MPRGTRRAPNILFIITDQQRADHCGFAGHPVLRTPNLDALASRSTRFDRAYVANPICMPSRSTIVTGRMPSAHGTRFNGIPLDWGAETFVRALRRHGYRTSLVGKGHFQNMGIPGVPEELFPGDGDAVQRPYPKGWDTLEDFGRHTRERVEFPDDFYGFAEVDLTVLHADRAGGHYYQWLLEQGIDPTEVCGRDNAVERFPGWYQVYRTALAEELYPSRYVEQRTIARLREAAAAEEPFFLWCSFPDPHHPFTPPGRWWDEYSAQDVDLPGTWDDPQPHAPKWRRRLLEDRGNNPLPYLLFAPTEEQFRAAAAAEYGAIGLLDDCVGNILAELDRLGLAEDTVIVFTSDHGDMFGDHGLMLKVGTHYDGCVRVPLLIHRPGQDTSAVSTSLVSLADLAPTLLDLADVPAYHGMQGTILTPTLEDPTTRVRDSLLIEEDWQADLLGVGRSLRMRTLITNDHRLTIYSGLEDGELFDLAGDPNELVDRWDEPAAAPRRRELTERLAHALMDVDDVSPIPTHNA